MKIAVLSASPKQQFSLTLQTVRALEKMFPQDEFDVHFIKKGIDHSEFETKANEADLVLVLSSLYHFNVHGQLIAYLEGIHIREGKPITYLTTSGGNMDVPAHNFMRSFARGNRLSWIKSLSLLDEDILQESGREELYRWFLYVKDMVLNTTLPDTALKDRSVILLDCTETEEETKDMLVTLRADYEALGAKVKTISLREKAIKGCIACFGCYTNNKCVIKDDFEELTQELYDNTDMIITVAPVVYNQFGNLYKYFLDRHVKFGRFSQDHEIYRAYVCIGETDGLNYAELEQHTYVVDSLDSDYFVGLFQTGEEALKDMVRQSALSCMHELFPQRNTYYYGLNLQFANLAYRLQNMTKKDYEYFKAKGYYEMPQIIPQVGPISGLEDGRMSAQMRLIAFEEMLSKLDGPPKLTKRGERSQFRHMIGALPSEPAADKTAKKGFGLFKKK